MRAAPSPQAKSKRVNFISQDLKISAVLTLPQTAKPDGGFPAVVLAQGLSGVKNVIMPEIAQTFAQAGIATLAFDYRGCGESEGDSQRLFPLERVTDILNAAAFLRSQAAIDAARIGIYGVSYGAGQALYAAALDPEVRCVVSVAGAIDGADFLRGLRTLDEWIVFKDRLRQDRIDRTAGKPSAVVPVTEVLPFPQRFLERYRAIFAANSTAAKPVASITLESAEAMAAFDLSGAVHRLAGRPALVVQGNRDDVIAIEDVLRVFRCMPEPKRFVEMTGCDHIDLDGGPAHERQVALAREFFTTHL